MSLLSRTMKGYASLGAHKVMGCLNMPVMRMKSTKEDCKQVICPKCAPENIAKTKCAKKKAEEKKQKKVMRLRIPEECCLDPCKDFLPRFDDLYYCPSDKTREYMQTWKEFRPIKIKRIPICCYDLPEYPPMERRGRRAGAKKRKESSCSKADRKTTLKLMKCMADTGKSKCPRVQAPCRRAGRVPPKCLKTGKTVKDCKKICCPYPSFSECERDPTRPRSYVECHCLAIPSMCEMFAEMRRIEELNKVSEC